MATKKGDRPYVIANWKMHTNLADALLLAEGTKNSIAEIKNINVVLCPPFTWLYPIIEHWRHKPSNLSLGAQDMHWEDSGAFTGEVSPMMLKGLVKYVIIGHSERRFHFHETDELVNDKIQAAVRHNLVPVVCVGERKKNMGQDSESQNTGKVDAPTQLVKALEGISANEAKKIIIAYEPVWAIGTGEAATGDYAARMAMQLRDRLKFLYDEEIADEIPILYGGSVKSDNVSEFTGQEEIDGVLVGTASLKLNEFLKICRMVAESVR